jgi:hypothetical protein
VPDESSRHKDVSSANTQSSLVQVLHATLGSEAEDMGFKAMKQLSKPANFRYAAGSRRVEVAVPQSNGRLYVRRRSVKTLRTYLEEPHAEENGGNDHGYTFWLAQCIHYGLEFPPTSLDAQRILRKAISGGLKKEPEHLRILAKELRKKHIEQYGKTDEHGEEKSGEAIVPNEEEPVQIIDNTQLIYEEATDTEVPGRQQRSPRPRPTSKLEVVIPRKTTNVSNLDVMKDPTVSIWDFPSDSEDNRISQHYHRAARGESFFDAALTEHLNYLYNEAEFDQFSEFEDESTGGEGIHERSSSRVTRSTVSNGNRGTTSEQVWTPSSLSPGTLSDLDRELEAAALRKRSKVKAKKKGKSVTDGSSKGVSDTQDVVSTPTPGVKSTNLKRRKESTRADPHKDARANEAAPAPKRVLTGFQDRNLALSSVAKSSDQSGSEGLNRCRQSETVQAVQRQESIVHSIEDNPLPFNTAQSRSFEKAIIPGKNHANSRTRSGPSIPSSSEPLVISSDSEFDHDLNHTFALPLRTRSLFSVAPNDTAIANRHLKPDVSCASRTPRPESRSSVTFQSAVLPADLQESQLPSRELAKGVTSRPQKSTGGKTAEQRKEDEKRELKRRKNRRKKERRKLRAAAEKKEGKEKTRIRKQRAEEEGTVAGSEATHAPLAREQASSPQSQDTSHNQEESRRLASSAPRKRARNSSLTDQADHHGKATASSGYHQPGIDTNGERPPKKARSATPFQSEKQEDCTSKVHAQAVLPAKGAKEEAGNQIQSSKKLDKKPKKDEDRTDEKARVRVLKNSPHTKPPHKTHQDILEDKPTKWRPTTGKAWSKTSVSRDMVPNSNPAPPRHPKEEKTDRPKPGEQAWRRITYTSNPMAGRRPGSYRLESVPPHHFRDLMTMEVPILGPGQEPQDLPPPRQVPNPDHGAEPPLELQWVAQHQAYKKKKLDDFLAKIPKDSAFAGLEPRVVSDSRGVRVQWA